MRNPDLQTVAADNHQDTFRLLKKYVRVRSAADARLVEFDFAIEDPELFVELVMPRAAFEEFCQKNAVLHMSAEQTRQIDAEMDKWRYGEETLMANNHKRANK